MANEPNPVHEAADAVEVPAPTVWPLVLSLGIVLLAAGVATSLAFCVVGAVLFAAGLAGWVGNLLPGRGHVHEPLAAPHLRPQSPVATTATVEHLRHGMPGYRMRLPEKVHPISAGIWGGVIGGAVMPIPALAYGFFSGHGIWYPINLLSGMVLPGVNQMDVPQLEQFSLTLLVLGVVIHATISIVIGLVYGVLLPTLPQIPGGQLLWGGVLLPLLWTAASYGLMGVVNPALEEKVSWPWFVVSQFVYGVAAAVVVIRSEKVHIPPAGLGPDRGAVTEASGQREGQP